MRSSNDFNPIRNWANELHAKESSKKVRAVKKLQAERGERLGGRPPYGYKKKAADSKEIIPDEETAPIVQRIFQLCASGKGPNQIARILMKDSILTPANYTYRKYGVSHSTLDTTLPFSWSQNTIKGILENKVYLGHTEGLRSSSISYKNKKRIEVGERSQKYSRHAAQSIRIIYRDIGDMDSAMEPGEKEPNMIPPLDATTDIPA